MFKKHKRKLVFFVAVVLLGGSIAYVYDSSRSVAAGDEAVTAEPSVQQTDKPLQPVKQSVPDLKDDMSIFRSNGYTMPETVAKEVPAPSVRGGYEKIGENSGMTLYMNKKTFAIQLKNNANGYVWSSTPEDRDMQEEELNEDWKNAMQSPFILDYFSDDATRTTSNFLSMHGKVIETKPISNGMEVTYDLADIQVKLTVKVVLGEDGLVVTLPNDSIVEEGSNRIASVQMYPFLGAVRGASVPGYLFIPDGSGALIRFTDNHTLYDEPYVGKIYGNDIGVNGFSYSDTMTGYPVFGIVQGVKQNALMGVVEDGKMNADIVAYPSGVNTNFYWVSPRFNIRYAYYQPTSKTMGGINMYTKNKSEGDKQVRYELLGGNQADYAGMAQEYRMYLQQEGMLPEKAVSTNSKQEDIPLRVDMLGGDIEPGVFKNHVVKMTSFEDVQSILTDLQKDGVTNLKAVLKGWGKDGMNGAQPSAPGYADVLGGKDGLKKLRDYTKQKGIDLYLYTDYSKMLDGSPRVDPRGDAVRMITNSLVDYHYVSRYVSDLFKDLQGYLLSPETALQLAKEDFQAFHEDGIEDVAIGSTGSMLYSDYHKGLSFNRTTAAQQYGKIGDEAAKQSLRLALFAPSDYMLKYSGTYFDMPIYSSQIMFETDTVPFIPMVLHGVMDYYSGYSNYNSDTALDLLRMIDYGANPSFIVTKEPSWKLQNTPSSDLFTTEYNDWSAEIKQHYAKVNAALKPVQHAFMTGRTVVSNGIVKVSYDNGVDVWVNYTGSDYEDGKVTVKARDFAVTGGGQS